MQTKNTKLDYTLISIVLLLGIVSCFALYTVQPGLRPDLQDDQFYLKQIVWYIVGSMFIVVIMLFDYDRLRQIVWPLYAIGMIALLMLFFNFPGEPFIRTANGATSWFSFPAIGTIQPSEFMKVILIITLAHVLVKHNDIHKKRTNKSDLLLLFKILILSVPPMLLIAVQPDLGGFLVFIAITASIILISGIRWRILFGLLFGALFITGILVAAYFLFPGPIQTFLEESIFKYVSGRFYGWLQPEKYVQTSGNQLYYALLAIGSGQLVGKGLMDMEVYVAERQTDMIFTAIAEQFGFVGASIVVTLLFLLIYRLIHVALQSNDVFGSYLVTGMIGMFSFQIFQNIGMSIQLLPITGLPLPFLSYGGSSTITYLLAIGIVLNIHSRTKEYMFD
ncbi:FtsW/RodA/SpoVE family cell cycle protein [Terrihalobacillus insolitus]|uniref:FtsW/RodA/SpoVE family cell cycle protein n=1 Tax=Terrihalobacillus insolitus TaxID=2950438 RepID=UPI00233FB937|nr:FtsW/RodA/SpoVE family cell cycle protein [Terrihalobacillus insolitus]MDC3413665.1 rod shape-determining protein RodA [Terrihalobacillus insolitus]